MRINKKGKKDFEIYVKNKCKNNKTNSKKLIVIAC